MSLTSLTTKYVGKQIFGLTVGSIFNYAKWILILSIISFVLYKGYDFFNHYNTITKTVESQANTIKELSDKLSTVEQANKRLEEEVSKSKKSGEVSSEVVGNLGKNQEQTTKKFEDIKTNVKEEVAKVKAKPVKRVVDKDKRVTEVSMQEGEITEAVSRIRITAIWRSYCSSNHPDESSTQTCKEVTI